MAERVGFGTIKPLRETTIKSWNRAFQKLFAAAEPPIVGGHAHRFRDTFPISLLLKGVDLANVSVLLGHSSIRIPSVTIHLGEGAPGAAGSGWSADVGEARR